MLLQPIISFFLRIFRESLAICFGISSAKYFRCICIKYDTCFKAIFEEPKARNWDPEEPGEGDGLTTLF